jgi:hypothetical protein
LTRQFPLRFAAQYFKEYRLQSKSMTRVIFPRLAAFLLSFALPFAAWADEPPAPGECATIAAPTGELAPWQRPMPITTASEANRAPLLAVGQAADAALLPTPQLHYPASPEKPGGQDSFGGLIAVDIAQPGTYRVALGSSAWIDLVRDGKAVTSTAHGHGPPCSGVRKIVDFPLTPGRYTLALAANPGNQTRVLVAHLP